MLMWMSFITLVRRFVKGGNRLQMGISVLKVNIRADNKAFFCSIIYVDNYYVSQRALWHNLVGHASLMRDKPWVLLGDFNAALNLEDHSCGGYQPDIAMREFKEYVQRMQVMDVNATGLHFTWNQKPKGSNGILKKIDRIMCNYHFLVDFPGSFTIFQPYRISDHSPCVIRIPKVSRPKPKPFRFSNFLIYKEGFRDAVSTGWNLNVHGRLCVELDEAQKAIDCNPSCSLLRDEHAHYLLAFKKASLDEERFLKQKSNIEWLKAGDANRAYFHRIVKSKCARNKIEMVRDSSNVLHEGNAVLGAFVSYYEQFLGDVSDREIKDALFSMGDDKAPEPDGFTAAFFKKSWDIVGGEITNAIRDFFSNGKLLKVLNHAIISLIPKVSTPAKINDYRPISCCNVLFKCISKVIANRIKEDLGDLVSINQSDFVPGRRISDNILLTQELMWNYHRKRGPPRCAFKVDIQKAYDTVDWGFLRSILVGFGFHHNMVEWIMVCVSTTSYYVCINGDMYGWFNGKRGLRQDDLFLFARGHPISVRVIIDALEEFKNVLGLVPSIPKSTAFFCNVPNALKASILSSMSFAEGTLPVKYLGVLISSRLLYRDCKVLVEKLESRCQGEMKKGKAKVDWEVVCLPYREGGLGIRRLDDFNVALMAYHELLGRSVLGWVDSCPLRDILTVRNIVRSRFSLSNTVSDLVFNGFWRWPHDWLSRFLNIVNIPVLIINDELNDVIVWRNVQGVFQHFSVAGAWDSLRLRADVVDWYHVCAFTGMSSMPPRLMDVLAFLIPSKGSSVSNVISRIVLATTTYCLWNEQNSRLFKKKKSSADQIVQLITSLVRMKLVTFKFKKMCTGSCLMLDQWKIPSSCFDHDRSSR
ncbi:hypothetical protein Tco_0453480 [Tanacetum coccineum]